MGSRMWLKPAMRYGALLPVPTLFPTGAIPWFCSARRSPRLGLWLVAAIWRPLPDPWANQRLDKRHPPCEGAVFSLSGTCDDLEILRTPFTLSETLSETLSSYTGAPPPGPAAFSGLASGTPGRRPALRRSAY